MATITSVPYGKDVKHRAVTLLQREETGWKGKEIFVTIVWQVVSLRFRHGGDNAILAQKTPFTSGKGSVTFTAPSFPSRDGWEELTTRLQSTLPPRGYWREFRKNQ